MKVRGFARLLGAVLVKLWASPNTLAGLVYGAINIVVGALLQTRPKISLGNNAIQFENCPLMKTAMCFGHVVVYGTRADMKPEAPRYGGRHTLGHEEMQHTFQAELLGPLYFPAHLVSGLVGLWRERSWHGRTAFLESGPHRLHPRPWPLTR